MYIAFYNINYHLSTYLTLMLMPYKNYCRVLTMIRRLKSYEKSLKCKEYIKNLFKLFFHKIQCHIGQGQTR